MKTPIYDFISRYTENNDVRMHMPGHKGKELLGFESYDITEIFGADSLYHADGIIKESEENASRLFRSGATFYSCEGSSLSIRAMLYLAYTYSGSCGYVLATRNAHSSFISSSALIGFDVEWLYPSSLSSYLSCIISPAELENVLSSVDKLPFALYITSPDYLGNICDIKGLSEVCRKYGVLLLVDNAHGAYLAFTDEKNHPILLGADMCTDSAHKTLSTITGGAYLHISSGAPKFFIENARKSLSLFGSTSPSYLILASLDKTNEYLENEYRVRLSDLISNVELLKSRLSLLGYSFLGDEKIKLTIDALEYGYYGTELGEHLIKQGIVPEFYDKELLVLMLSPENDENDLNALYNALAMLPKKASIEKLSIPLNPPERVMSMRDAIFKKGELVNIDDALNKALAFSVVSCPPAVSIIACGERVNQSVIEISKYYGIEKLYVIKEKE